MTSVGFEYTNKNDETPFETFLRYTDEKKKSAAKLATVLQQRLHFGSRILDIGTGNGEYLRLALSQIDGLDDVKLTLVEPSTDLSYSLAERFANYSVEIVHSNLEDFSSQEKFDVVLMSHLFYHVPRTLWADQLAKALSLLSENGALVIVLREKDDAYDFKMAFKPLLFSDSFKALTIDDVIDVLPGKQDLKVARQSAASELHFPIGNQRDTVAIIEFYLNKQWQEIPATIQQSVLGFIKQRRNTFQQMDGIAVVGP
jgi:cyclopropane fatty-acyl-phospholipid synthase-like methyltransferase